MQGNLRHAILVATIFMIAANASDEISSEHVDIIVPFNKDGTYSLHDFCRACNATLKTGYPLDKIQDRRILISREEKNLLKILSLFGVESRFEPGRFILRLPISDSEALRNQQRQEIERALNIPPGTWPGDLGLRLPTDLRPDGRSMLFIHGLYSTTREFGSFAKTGRQAQVQIFTFDYPNRGDLKLAGRRLADDLRKLQKEHPKIRLVIVAHSMGGLIARHALEVADNRLSCVTDLFLIGTPHRGSRLAKFQPLLEFSKTILSPAKENLACTGLGEARFDLEPGSEFLVRLAKASRNPHVRYHTVAGTRGLVDPEDLPELRRLCEAYLRRQNAPQEERARLRDYVERLDEIVSGKGDGAVSLDSACLPGADTERRFSLNHLQLVDTEHSDVINHILATLNWRVGGP